MAENVLSNSNESNTRPYGIFVTYMLTCLGAAIFIINKLFARTARPAQLPQRRGLVLFATLAICSLLSTWSFMFRYFQWSYDNWLIVRSHHDLDPSVKHWGLWLKETSLFKEAWESVIVGHSRYWWSHQIFFFASALGLHSEWKGVRRGITYTWAFMLLGQIVAISFATNLYFLTLLVTLPQQELANPHLSQKPKANADMSASDLRILKWIGPWLIDGMSVILTSAAAERLSREKYWNGAPGFLPLLLLPHAVLLILPSLRALLPVDFFPQRHERTVDNIYRFLWSLNFFFVGPLAWTTYQAYVAGNLGDIRDTLFEHPAVSSVGFDVIFCWISWLCWWQTQSEQLL